MPVEDPVEPMKEIESSVEQQKPLRQKQTPPLREQQKPVEPPLRPPKKPVLQPADRSSIPVEPLVELPMPLPSVEPPAAEPQPQQKPVVECWQLMPEDPPVFVLRMHQRPDRQPDSPQKRERPGDWHGPQKPVGHWLRKLESSAVAVRQRRY